MDYTRLDTAAQRAHIEDQIAFLERQHLDATLKVQFLSATARPDADQIGQLKANLADFDAMHAAAVEALDALSSPAPVETPDVPAAASEAPAAPTSV